MKKITKAMQLVAASKMKGFQARAVSSRRFTQELISLYEGSFTAGSTSKFTQSPQGKKVLFILYTSDKGLCGGLNTQLTKALLNNEQWKTLGLENRDLITIGKKARDFAYHQEIPVNEAFVGIREQFETHDLLPLIGSIVNLWETGAYQQVNIIAPHYKNSFTFYPVVKTLLPFSDEMIASFLGKEALEAERSAVVLDETVTFLEPSHKAIHDRLERMMLVSLVSQSLYELKASEYSSRMIAMQNATDAATKIVDQKTLEYNKIRQQVITQQISEIASAAEAQ